MDNAPPPQKKGYVTVKTITAAHSPLKYLIQVASVLTALLMKTQIFHDVMP